VQEASRMLADELQTGVQFHFHETNFAQLVVFGRINQRKRPRVRGRLRLTRLFVIADPELQAEIVTQWNNAVKHAVIADGPRDEGENENRNGSDDESARDRLPRLWVDPEPSVEAREHNQHRGIGVSGKPSQHSE